MAIIPKKYLPEVRDRAVRMVFEHVDDYGSVTAACHAVGGQRGIARETLRRLTVRIRRRWPPTSLTDRLPPSPDSSCRRATAVRRTHWPWSAMLPDVLDGKIEPGQVFDRTIGLEKVPDGYCPMANR